MSDGYKLHQGDYILDLCDKKGVTAPSIWRGTVLQEAEDEQFDIATLREAQALVGELQWVKCRIEAGQMFAMPRGFSAEQCIAARKRFVSTRGRF